jgi:chromate transporter
MPRLFGAGRGAEPAPTPVPEPDDAPTAVEAGEQAEELGRGSVFEVLRVALRLGLTSFGGPIAHLGYFRDEYVLRRRWLDERTYADLVALCQFLPGAASSKLGMSIGILRAGPLGGLVAWLGFTLPSAAALTAVALLLKGADQHTLDLLHGLKVVAVAVVAQAVWGMARNLAPDAIRATVAVVAAGAALTLPTSIAQISVIAAAAVFGFLWLRPDETATPPAVRTPVPRWAGVTCWVLLLGLLALLPLLRTQSDSHTLAMFDSFYRSGLLVFGGGHVVLPLLQAQVVDSGWIGNGEFLAGYGFAQAVPGPLFTFAAFLGAAMGPEPNGVPGAIIALVAIFLPSMLMAYGALPWWGLLRSRRGAVAALRGVNAAVVGILLAALYDPVWTTAILKPEDFVLGLGAFAALMFWRWPPWLVVALTGSVGALMVQF